MGTLRQADCLGQPRLTHRLWCRCTTQFCIAARLLLRAAAWLGFDFVGRALPVLSSILHGILCQSSLFRSSDAQTLECINTRRSSREVQHICSGIDQLIVGLQGKALSLNRSRLSRIRSLSPLRTSGGGRVQATCIASDSLRGSSLEPSTSVQFPNSRGFVHSLFVGGRHFGVRWGRR